LLATHSEKGWNFTEEGGQYAPAAPQGVIRGDVQGQSFVIGNPSDEAALKAIVGQANAYADRVAMALPADMPPGVKTIAKLAKAGLSEDAMLTQAHSDGTAYKLTANQIVYLSKVGVPQDVIKALLVGNQAPSQPESETAEQTPSPNEQPEQEAAPAAPPPAPTVTTISLPANFQWLDTGIDLAPGQTVSINASGKVTALFRLTVPFLGTHLVPAVFGVGPDGGGSYNSNNTLDPFLAPGLPAFSLVGKVADSAPFEVGSSSTFPSPAGGRLYLSINANSFESNLGMWTVTITQGAGPAAEAAPPSQVSFDYFHDQLAPYGNWVQVPDYGWAWSPGAAATDPAWRPYADQGQWVYTDAGLYWHSAYPWGDIAFHYGRWTYDTNNGGWLWVPGYDWAPAWVAWRYAEADGYAGWAPLPPSAVFVAGVGLMFNSQLAVDVDFGLPWDAFVFVGYDHFWDRGYRGLFLDRYRVREFYGRSFIRNGYRFENGRFRVEGVGRDRIGHLTHRNVRAVNVHNLRAREEKTHFDARHAQAVRSGARAPERTGENRKAQVRPSGGPANQRQAAPQAKKPSAKPAPASSKKDDKKKGN
jgi:hypothetical protein